MNEPDTATAPRHDDVERAHLVDPADRTYRIGRWAPDDDLRDLVRRYWVPTWSVPVGQEAEQQVLQHPACLLVVADSYARLYGVTPGLSTTTLRGTGWAVGVMLRPAAGALLLGGPLAAWAGRHAPLVDALAATAPRTVLETCVAAVRATMTPGPTDPVRQHAATDLVGDLLRRWLPVDDEGLLVNAVVAAVEDDPGIVRVAQLCERFGTPERTLQRLVRRRLGITPRWLVQRRRLHEAAGALRERTTTLAEVAARLGYADEAHLSRDFRRVTGMTPGAFSARFGGHA